MKGGLEYNMGLYQSPGFPSSSVTLGKFTECQFPYL